MAYILHWSVAGACEEYRTCQYCGRENNRTGVYTTSGKCKEYSKVSIEIVERREKIERNENGAFQGKRNAWQCRRIAESCRTNITDEVMKRARLFLLPCSLLYWVAVVLRNWFFDIGILKTTKVSVPVISVGNISTGGVGKTPIVEMLIERLGNNRRLSVVSRGYGRKSVETIVVSDGCGNFASVEDAGDEPSQLARKFSNLIVVVDEKRARGSQKAIELGAEIILLDDGFQHRYLHRDLNLMVMTVEEIVNGDWLLPAGDRREPMSSLKRANALVITRCKDMQDFEQAKRTIESKLRAEPRPFLGGEGIVGVQIKLKSLKLISSNETLETGTLAGKKVIAVSGIGNPKTFESLLEDTGMIVVKHFMFSDHHWFSDEDIQTIIKARKALSVDFIVTTEKDIMRLRERFVEFLKTEPVIVAEIQQVFVAGKDMLDALIKQVISSCGSELQIL
jgi:tetraacyldisaccharide 4'-kinase